MRLALCSRRCGTPNTEGQFYYIILYKELKHPGFWHHRGPGTSPLQIPSDNSINSFQLQNNLMKLGTIIIPILKVNEAQNLPKVTKQGSKIQNHSGSRVHVLDGFSKLGCHIPRNLLVSSLGYILHQHTLIAPSAPFHHRIFLFNCPTTKLSCGDFEVRNHILLSLYLQYLLQQFGAE